MDHRSSCGKFIGGSKLITFNFQDNVRSFRNLLNVHRHASKVKSFPVLSGVRIRYAAGEQVLTMLATDRYTIAEVALPLADPVDTDFEGFVRAEDIARVHKQTKVSTQEFSFTVDEDRGTFYVDGEALPVAVAKKGDSVLGSFPSVDRLWRESLTNTDPVAELGVNTSYLDRFRHLNEKTTGAVRMSFNGTKPVVVLPVHPAGWRGMIVGVRVPNENDIEKHYAEWQQVL